MQIFANFVASGVAAKACNAVDAADVTKFGANTVTVATRATMALKERNPALSEKELSERVTKVIEGIKLSVQNEVEKNGCGSNRIQELLKLYKMHTKMDLH